jgi:predicted transcriptional regulator
MSQTTVRISEATHHLLKELSRAKKEPMQAILEYAVEEYRRRHFLESVNEAYAALRSNDQAWTETQADHGEWDQTLSDGLPRDEAWAEDGRPASRPVSNKKARRR